MRNRTQTWSWTMRTRVQLEPPTEIITHPGKMGLTARSRPGAPLDRRAPQGARRGRTAGRRQLSLQPPPQNRRGMVPRSFQVSAETSKTLRASLASALPNPSRVKLDNYLMF